MINYSFIIPHKNCPTLLKRCVDSIPFRDDIQIIVVDDNSDVDKQPSFQRNDVEVIKLNAEQSKGAGRARNVGIEHAKGKWILFADADDCYTENLVDLLEKYAKEDTIDVVYLNACVFDENGYVGPFIIGPLINNYLAGKHYSEKNLRYGVWTPWTRMVRFEFVKEHQLWFDEIPVGNDVYFGLQCSFYAKRIKVEQNYIYQYYRLKKQKSLTREKRNENVLGIVIDLCVKKIDLYKKARYKYIPSFYALFHNSKYSQNIQRTKRREMYHKTLKDKEVSFFVDLYRYFHIKLHSLVSKITL